MKILKSERKLCYICMKEHQVDTVEVIDTEIFKDEEVSFISTYEFCDDADEYLESEEMIKANSQAMRDAYRKKMGLLTPSEIIELREK